MVELPVVIVAKDISKTSGRHAAVSVFQIPVSIFKANVKLSEKGVRLGRKGYLVWSRGSPVATVHWPKAARVGSKIRMTSRCLPSPSREKRTLAHLKNHYGQAYLKRPVSRLSPHA